MVEVDPSKRLSALQCLEHKWFKEENGNRTLSASITPINAEKDSAKQMSKINKEATIITCTPVMCARGNLQDTSPIMISRPIIIANNEDMPVLESKYAKTPVIKAANNILKQSIGKESPLKKYLANEERKPSCLEEDYANDMEEKICVNLKETINTSNKNYSLLCHNHEYPQSSRKMVFKKSITQEMNTFGLHKLKVK